MKQHYPNSIYGTISTGRNFFLAVCSLALLLLAGCGGNPSANEEDSLITVDVTKSYPEKELILQDLFDIEYVPLETTEEFLTFGFVKAITDKYIITKNATFRDGDIFIFGRDGKAVKKINHKGSAEGEYVFTSHIFFDDEKEELYVSCLATSKIFIYDLLGNFKRSFQYGEDNASPIVYQPMYSFDSETMIGCDYTSGRWVNEREALLDNRNMFHLISKKDGRILTEIRIPFEEKVSQVLYTPDHVGIVRNDELIPFHDHWLLVDPSSDTIYRYTLDKELIPFMVREPSIQTMDPEIFLFPGVITDRYYFMQAIKKEFDESDPYSKLAKRELLYDKEEKRMFEYVLRNRDFMGETSVGNLTFDVLSLVVKNNKDIAFAIRLETPDLVDAYKEGQLREGSRLAEIASTLHEEDNPVILIAKYKK